MVEEWCTVALTAEGALLDATAALHPEAEAGWRVCLRSSQGEAVCSLALVVPCGDGGGTSLYVFASVAPHARPLEAAPPLLRQFFLPSPVMAMTTASKGAGRAALLPLTREEWHRFFGADRSGASPADLGGAAGWAEESTQGQAAEATAGTEPQDCCDLEDEEEPPELGGDKDAAEEDSRFPGEDEEEEP